MVKVYTSIGCPYCYTLKEFFKKYNIDFEEIDISQNKEARDDIIKRSGGVGAPIIEIDGEIIVGFDKQKIVNLLKIQE